MTCGVRRGTCHHREWEITGISIENMEATTGKGGGR